MITPLQKNILAKTLWGEARGEGRDGQKAVLCSIVNRVKKPCWWGKTIDEVCLKDWQYSCWNKKDPNYAKLQELGSQDLAREYSIIDEVLGGVYSDMVAGATHYHTPAVSPSWAIGKKPCMKFGNHLFYNDID